MVGWHNNEITRKDMEDIYELTYKYQMLRQEEKYGDQGLPQPLPDRAYMELARVSAELSNRLAEMFDRMIEVYEDWIEHHTQGADEELAESIQEDIEYDIGHVKTYNDIVEVLESWWGETSAEKKLRDTIADQAYKNLETWRRYDAIEPEQQEYYNSLDFNRMTLEQLLEVPFVKEDQGFFGDVRDALLDRNDIYEIVNERLEAERESYYQETALGGAIDMLDKLRYEWEELPDGLDKDILLFQEALTTAHNNGSMAEYLITNRGYPDRDAVEFLHELSAGPHVDEWNRELSQMLGYPLGSRSAPTQEWYTMSHLRRAMLMLASLTQRPASLALS